jgi:hypothetical protein
VSCSIRDPSPRDFSIMTLLISWAQTASKKRHLIPWRIKSFKAIFGWIFWDELKISSNFGHCSRSRRSKIFSYGRRPSAFSPTLYICIVIYTVVIRWLIPAFKFPSKIETAISQILTIRWWSNYRMRTIIASGLYTFYPLFEVHLCTVTFCLMSGFYQEQAIAACVR